MTKKKTWEEKLYDNKNLPKVEKLTGKMAKKWGEGTIAIPSPIEVDEIMRKVPKVNLLPLMEYVKELLKSMVQQLAVQ